MLLIAQHDGDQVGALAVDAGHLAVVVNQQRLVQRLAGDADAPRLLLEKLRRQLLDPIAPGQADAVDEGLGAEHLADLGGELAQGVRVRAVQARLQAGLGRRTDLQRLDLVLHLGIVIAQQGDDLGHTACSAVEILGLHDQLAIARVAVLR